MNKPFSIRIEKKTATNLRYLILTKGLSSYTEAIDWLLSNTIKSKARRKK